MTGMTVAFILVGGWLSDRPQTYETSDGRARPFRTSGVDRVTTPVVSLHQPLQSRSAMRR
jgi:hypothetical protein